MGKKKTLNDFKTIEGNSCHECVFHTFTCEVPSGFPPCQVTGAGVVFALKEKPVDSGNKNSNGGT